MNKHEVKLTVEEKQKLKAIITIGENKAVVISRAHILLKVDEGKTDSQISDMLYVSEQTIRRTRLRYGTEGLERALKDKVYPPRDRKLKDTQEAHLIAVACSPPPQGMHAGHSNCYEPVSSKMVL